MGTGSNPAEPKFFCVGNPRELSATSQWPIFTKFGHKTVQFPVNESGKIFLNIFTLRVICHKTWNRKLVKQAPHSEQVTGHGIHCREILFTPRCSPSAGSFRGPVNFSVRRTVAELRSVKVAKFSDIGLFSPYKIPKMYLPVTSLQPRGYITEWLRFLHVVVERLKGCLLAAVFFCDFRSQKGSPNLPKFLPMANGYTHTECYSTARQIWTTYVWKCAILRVDVLFHQFSSPLPPKSAPKHHFGDLSMQNLLYTELSVCCTLMVLRCWNFSVI